MVFIGKTIGIKVSVQESRQEKAFGFQATGQPFAVEAERLAEQWLVLDELSEERLLPFV